MFIDKKYYLIIYEKSFNDPFLKKCSASGTRTRVFWVRARYPDQLD